MRRAQSNFPPTSCPIRMISPIYPFSALRKGAFFLALPLSLTPFALPLLRSSRGAHPDMESLQRGCRSPTSWNPTHASVYSCQSRYRFRRRETTHLSPVVGFCQDRAPSRTFSPADPTKMNLLGGDYSCVYLASRYVRYLQLITAVIAMQPPSGRTHPQPLGRAKHS